MVMFGFHTLHFSPMFGGAGDLTATAAACLDAGFDCLGVDLATLRQGADRDAVDLHAYARTVANRLSSTGIGCSDLVPLYGDANAATTAQELAPIVKSLGARWCVVSVVQPFAWTRLVSVLREAAAIVGEAGAGLAVEFMQHSALQSLEHARRLCDEIGWDLAGLVLDSFHCLQAKTPTSEVARLDPSEIAIVQYSDAGVLGPRGLADASRNGRRVPGDGVLELPAWVDAVTATGYDSLVVAEVLSDELRRLPPLDVAMRCHDALERDWGARASAEGRRR